ncbi:septum formation family protein [Actinomadura rifamycini]|uniref:septum formation family protein n=1 Tax=Actinomadura rifamycini TaxID=31962 RepID=UPI000406944B|nr:septum formation family protein [Actinomadura rifamycini]
MTTPPDAPGADDSPSGSTRRPTGAVPFPDAPSPAPASFSGALPFADAPGTEAPPFAGLPETDASPPPPAGTYAAPSQGPPLPVAGLGAAGLGAAGTPPPAAKRRTARFAVIALVTGLFGLVPVALGFGIAALLLRRGNRRGRSFAIAGIAASLAWSAIVYLLGPVALEALFAVERDRSGAISKPGTTLFSVLRKGDCFTGDDLPERLRLVEAVPCTEPHTGEVLMRAALPDGPWPGGERAELATRVACGRELVRLRKSTAYPSLLPYFEVPNVVNWKTGDREAACAVHHPDGAYRGRLADTVKPGRRTFDELARWRCVRNLAPEKLPLVAPVSCAKPHAAQVFAT